MCVSCAELRVLHRQSDQLDSGIFLTTSIDSDTYMVSDEQYLALIASHWLLPSMVKLIYKYNKIRFYYK